MGRRLEQAVVTGDGVDCWEERVKVRLAALNVGVRGIVQDLDVEKLKVVAGGA